MLHLSTLSALRAERAQDESLATAVDLHAWGHNEATLLHNATAGAWLHALPTSAALTISNAELRHSLRWRLALHLREQGATCQACEAAGAASHALDQQNTHDSTCKHGHNRVRDIIAEYARRTHTQVTTEQRWATERRDAAAGSRALKTADIHIQQGPTVELWLDIRVTTAKDSSAKTAMMQAERAKCREYGQDQVPMPGVWGTHLIPVVFERDGSVTACTAALLKFRRNISR